MKLKEKLQRENFLMNKDLIRTRAPSVNLERTEVPTLYVILFGVMVLVFGIMAGKLL